MGSYIIVLTRIYSQNRIYSLFLDENIIVLTDG
jgi:hypothetical protein